MYSPGKAGVCSGSANSTGQLEDDKCFRMPVTMGISNHKATLWAWFNLAVFVFVCAHVCVRERQTS